METDVHLTADHVPVLFHDGCVSERLCRTLPGARVPAPSRRPAVGTLTLAELRGYRADCNPCPDAFPAQDAAVTPLAGPFAAERGMDPYTPPALEELFAFCAAYAGAPGQRAGKAEGQRQRARGLRFELELKRVPFRPETLGDGFAPGCPGLLERRVVEAARRAGVVARAIVRSFDHRSVAAARLLEPGLTAAVIVAGTAPAAPADLARRAGAQVYCPDYEFLDEAQVRQLHAEGIRVVPWTVNRAEDWDRLLAWGVDGITTDFPDRLAAVLRQRGIPF